MPETVRAGPRGKQEGNGAGRTLGYRGRREGDLLLLSPAWLPHELAETQSRNLSTTQVRWGRTGHSARPSRRNSLNLSMMGLRFLYRQVLFHLCLFRSLPFVKCKNTSDSSCSCFQLGPGMFCDVESEEMGYRGKRNLAELRGWFNQHNKETYDRK